MVAFMVKYGWVFSGLVFLSVTLCGIVLLGVRQIDPVVLTYLLSFTILITLVIACTVARIAWVFHKKSKRIQRDAEKMSAGDLTVRIVVPNEKPCDEWDRIALLVNSLVDNMAAMAKLVMMQTDSSTLVVREMGSIRRTLKTDTEVSHRLSDEVLVLNNALHEETDILDRKATESSADSTFAFGVLEQLSTHIGIIASSSNKAQENVAIIASSADEMSRNLLEVSGNLEQVDSSIQKVSRAIGSMTGSLEEVRSQCESASLESSVAMEHSSKTQEIMGRLSKSAQAIGHVVDVINNIAEQTNMLALNASIEAAGAGDAGSGFSVVADEVKELARQTAREINMISDRIDEIQMLTQEAEQSSGNVYQKIERISQGNLEITRSVAKQADIVQEIAGSMDGIANATHTVTESAANIGTSAQEVASATRNAAESTREIAHSAAEMAESTIQVKEGSFGAVFKTQQIQNTVENLKNMAFEVQQKTMELIQLSMQASGLSRHTGHLIEITSHSSASLSKNVIDLKVSPPHFDPKVFKVDYLEWIGSIEQWMTGRISVTSHERLDSKKTVLGRWCVNEGNALFGQQPEFVALQEIQQKLEMSVQTIAQHMLERNEILIEQSKKPEKVEDSLDDFLFEFEEENVVVDELSIKLEAVRKMIDDEIMAFMDHFHDLMENLDTLCLMSVDER